MLNTKIVTQKGMKIAQVLPKHNNYVMHTDIKISKYTHSLIQKKGKQADPKWQQQPHMLQNYA